MDLLTLMTCQDNFVPTRPPVFDFRTKRQTKALELDRQQELARQREYNARRPDRHKFYGSGRWQRFRAWAQKESEFALCKICKENGRLTPMAILDHIKPVEDRPDLALDPKNIRAMCRSCHERYGARQTKRTQWNQDP